MKPLVFTNHALEQAQNRCSFHESDCRRVIKDCKEITLPPKIWADKIQKYGMRVVDTHYLYDEAEFICFTIVEKDDCYLVVTVSKKKYRNIEIIENGLCFDGQKRITK